MRNPCLLLSLHLVFVLSVMEDNESSSIPNSQPVLSKNVEFPCAIKMQIALGENDGREESVSYMGYQIIH